MPNRVKIACSLTNKLQTHIKILYFDRSGYCLWAKRLEQGRFHYNPKRGEKQALDVTKLKLLIEGRAGAAISSRSQSGSESVSRRATPALRIQLSVIKK